MEKAKMKLILGAGDKLVHKVNKQSYFVINDDGKTVYLLPENSTFQYPLNKLSEDFKLVEKYHKKEKVK